MGAGFPRCACPVLVSPNYVTPLAPSREKLKDKRNQGKDQEQMNQKARDMVHDKAPDPGEKQ
jgi:hypothetical protein